jgi:hypothetical protein
MEMKNNYRLASSCFNCVFCLWDTELENVAFLCNKDKTCISLEAMDDSWYDAHIVSEYHVCDDFVLCHNVKQIEG